MAPQVRLPKTTESPGGRNGVSVPRDVPREALNYKFPTAMIEERIANEANATKIVTEFFMHGITIDTEAFERYADTPQLTNYAGVFTALVEFADVLVARGVKRISTCASKSQYDESLKTYYISGAQFSAAGIREALKNEGNRLPESAHKKTPERIADRTIASGMAVPAGRKAGPVVAAGRKPEKRPSAAEQEQKLKGNRLYVAQAVLNAKFPGKGFKAEKLTNDYTQFKVMNASGEYAKYIIVVSQNPPFTATLIGKEVKDGEWVTISRENFRYANDRAITQKGPLAESLGTPG